MSIRDKFLKIEEELSVAHVERQEVIRGLLAGLLARQNVLLVGPPGADKSGLTRDFCSRIHGRYFEWLLTRTSTPEELFGPISLKALEADSYRRITTGKLPEAEVGFIDEIFKGSSAILNTLLSVMNERVFFNDGQPTQTALQIIVGASNELPEDKEELDALFDRFHLRYNVGWIRDENDFIRMLMGGNANGAASTITVADLEQARKEAAGLDASGVTGLVLALRARSRVMGLAVSDRRWKAGVGLLKANAWLNGHAAVEEEDAKILANVLWSSPEQRPLVLKEILTQINPYEVELNDLLDQAETVFDETLKAEEAKQTQAGMQAVQSFNVIIKKLEGLAKRAMAEGKSSKPMEGGKQKVQAMNGKVMQEVLRMPMQVA